MILFVSFGIDLWIYFVAQIPLIFSIYIFTIITWNTNKKLFYATLDLETVIISLVSVS